MLMLANVHFPNFFISIQLGLFKEKGFSEFTYLQSEVEGTQFLGHIQMLDWEILWEGMSLSG